MWTTTMERTSRWSQRAGMTFGTAALCVTYACGGSPSIGGVAAQPLATDHTSTPVVVGCEAHQRTLVRQAVINGAVVSQVECVSVAQTAYPAPMGPAPVAAQPAAAYAAAPVAYAPPPVVYAPPVAHAPAPVTRPVSRPIDDDLGDARVVHTASGGAAPVRTRQVVYEQPRPRRSAAKSAVIIGSSAGAGAGVGAIIGGKKGALIGAAVGGGGAAVWDQATRRK